MFFTSYKKYGPINSHDIVKFVAVTAMIIDHAGLFLFQDIVEFRLIGRLSFPLFLFLVGYSLQYRFRSDLMILAVGISLFDAIVHYPIFPLNILFTIALTRVVLNFLAKKEGYIEQHLALIVLFVILWWFPLALLLDYGSTAILWAVCGYLVRKNLQDRKVLLFFIVVFVGHFLGQFTGFDFSFIHQLLLFLSLPLLFWFTYNYRIIRFPSLEKRVFLLPILFISRNSLQIYFLHLLIFKAIAIVLYYENFQGFRFF